MEQPQMNIDPSKTTIIECKAVGTDPMDGVMKPCGSTLWDQKIQLRKVSALLSPTGKEMFLQAPILVCAECNTELETEMRGVQSVTRNHRDLIPNGLISMVSVYGGLYASGSDSLMDRLHTLNTTYTSTARPIITVP